MSDDYRNKLERFIIHAVLVAGKTAKTANAALEKFLDFGNVGDGSPFAFITNLLRSQNHVETVLRIAKTGNYTKNARALWELATSGINLEACSVADLEAIHGIGPKTARYFILYTRRGARVAALDTHILKFLRSVGIDAPKSTPPKGKRYDELEQAFLAEADKRGVTPHKLDAEIWDMYSAGGNQA